jgi:pyruvate,water dikinase
MTNYRFIKWLDQVRKNDTLLVGPKAANLGEMISGLAQLRVKVPDGFIVTTEGWRYFIQDNKLEDEIKSLLKEINFSDASVVQTLSKGIWQTIEHAPLPLELKQEIHTAYESLEEKYYRNLDVAVRSSAIAEDIEGASFAGQHETFLNVRGKDKVVEAVRKCFASLFNERVLVYRHEKGFSPMPDGIAVVIQKMVRSDQACSGVMFTVEQNSGFPGLIGIEAGWGLGESIVQGLVTPDEYWVSKELLKRGYKALIGKTLGTKERKMVYDMSAGKGTILKDTSDEERENFVLSEQEVLELGRLGLLIERHYGHPVDIEWAKDGNPNNSEMNGEFFIVQTRPVTGLPNPDTLRSKKLIEQAGKDQILVEGLAAGPGVGRGKVQIIYHANERFVSGRVLVTPMTDPDWVALMRKAAAIVTDQGGQKCHAAIVARELGIPCVVGTSKGTKILSEEMEVTVDCGWGDKGRVWRGLLKIEETVEDLRRIRELKSFSKPQIMMILGDPWVAWQTSFLPNDGIGLARLEFIIANSIGIHPKVALEDNPAKLLDPDTYKKICLKTKGYSSLRDYFVERLSQGIAQLALSVYPKPIIVRFSDFKTNEYRQLLGGEYYEPQEENPMLGWRGASRYYHPSYAQAFFLECEALQKARESMGLSNIKVMVPFCRTPEEGSKVLETMGTVGLRRGERGLEIGMMAEIPSNVILAEEFATIFDFFSIGSNDLTQLVFGIDRDNEKLASIADERNPALLRCLEDFFSKIHRSRTPVGICGQGPSLYPELTKFLVEQGIDSISVMPDAVPRTIEIVASIVKKNQDN